MHRDSQHGLTIDLSGSDGNAFVLMGYARQYAKQLNLDHTAIVAEMMLGDYNNLVSVFEREFGSVVTLLNKPGECFEPATNICPECEGGGCDECDHTGEIFE